MDKDYTANSKKSKETEKPREKIESVVTGPVIQKPPSIGYKFKTIFFGGDFKSSATYVVANVFWPTLRNLAFEIVVEGARGVFFGESSYRQRQQPTNYGSRFQYSSPSQLPRPDPRPMILGPSMTRVPDQRPFRPQQVNRREMNQIILYSRQEAENVLERMTDVFDQYNVVSVADLFEILGLETSPIDNKWGWTYIHNTEIRQVKEGFLLDLPPVEVI